MKTGTKSVLFGAHQFLIHPLFVAEAWRRLYGWPRDPRLWVAFFVHDLGYIGKSNMDDEEGERHVIMGAQIMGTLFDQKYYGAPKWCRYIARFFNRYWGKGCPGHFNTWYCFSFYHSRFMSKRYNMPVSQLCYPDKLSITIEPWWLYLPRVKMSGEIKEYMELADIRYAAGEQRFQGKYTVMNVWDNNERQWFANVQEYMRRWIKEHKDGKEDEWTPDV